MELSHSSNNAAAINLIWEKYIEQDPTHSLATAGRKAPNSYCVRQRLWALGKTFRLREMQQHFAQFYQSGLFYADLGVYRIMLNVARASRDLARIASLLSEMKSKNIKPDQSLYNMVISAFVAGGETQKAKQLLEEMANDGFLPDQTTFESLLILGCTDNSTPAENLVSLLRRAFASGSYVPKGRAWRTVLVHLLQSLQSDQISDIVAEALRLNPEADIDVLDSLLFVNIQRFVNQTAEVKSAASSATVDTLWQEAMARLPQLSDSTISLMLQFTEIAKGAAAAVQLVDEVASRFLSQTPAKLTISTSARLLCEAGQLDACRRMLNAAVMRSSRPLRADAFGAIVRNLRSHPASVLVVFQDYISHFGWWNNASISVARAALEALSRSPVVANVRPTAAPQIENMLSTPVDPSTEGLVALSSLISMLDSVASASKPLSPEFVLLVLDAHVLTALAQMNRKADSSRLLRRSLYWFNEAAREGIDANLAITYRLALALVQAGGDFEAEGEKLLRRASRLFSGATPRTLLWKLLQSKTRRVGELFQESRQFVSKTPLLANISSELDDIVQLQHQLLELWSDCSTLTDAMTHLALDGVHGRHRALELFYDTFRKYRLLPPPSSFRLALNCVSDIRDDAIELLDGRVDTLRRGSYLKREEALRLYDLYRRYRPTVQLRASDTDRADSAPAVSFDAKVTKDLIRVMADCGYIIEAEHLAREVGQVDALEGIIASIPLIVAYAKGGRLADSAKVFQQVLGSPKMPPGVLLESLRLMLHACADAHRIDVAWEIWNTVTSVPQNSDRAPAVSVNEWATMAFILAKREDYAAVLKLFDMYRLKNPEVETVVCLRFIRALKRLPMVTLEERGALTQTIESAPSIMPPNAVDQFRATIQSWIRRAESNEATELASEL
eukprot:TRINITY_DN498_c0_g1_i1.p1 TRINITY_DN498_c0_g1~~TRINITY_DN498_c0_g1_i1.p1  ORF type:complete len:983 (-),score=139.66 TRINITY_DN498_c0_g1_i1:679-3390(-)